MFVARLTMFVSRRCVRFGVFVLALCVVMRRLYVMMGCGVVSLIAASLLPDRSRRDLAVEYDLPAPVPALSGPRRS